MTDAGTPRDASPSAGAPSVQAEVEPELSRLERKVLEAYAAPAPPRGAVDKVLAALFAESETEPVSPSRTDGLAPRR